MLGERTLRDALLQVAHLAVETIPHCDVGGVTLRRPDRSLTFVSTDPIAQRIDDQQYVLGEGPCLDAMRTGEVFVVADMRSETRWPEYAPRAADEGVCSSLSLPLAVGSSILGALNLYSLDAPFAGEDELVGRRLAEQAAVALANTEAFDRTLDLVDNLRRALESRDLIGQAKGILMATHGLDADRAFDTLRELSQHRNVKLRDVAQEVVDAATRPTDAADE